MSYFVLVHKNARAGAALAVMNAPAGYVVRISEPTRSLEQNALLWKLLDQVSRKVTWHGRKLDAESWKHIFSSSLKRQDVVPNLDGTGFVVLGQSTSKMTKAQFSELCELIMAFAVQQGIELDEMVAA